MKSVKYTIVSATAIATLLTCNSLHGATIIDFTYSDSLHDGTVLSTIADLNFSAHLYSHPDGFHMSGGVAYNYYGESGEFITFDNPVLLESIDVSGTIFGLPQAITITLDLYDSNSLFLATRTIPGGGAFQTLLLQQDNVSKVVFTFTGGGPAYGDGRNHAWYAIDNITYSPASIPEPSAALLLFFGMGAFASRRHRNKIPSNKPRHSNGA